MARQLWMADVLRAAGLTVHEVAGWRTRGTTDFAPQGLIAHETRGSLTSSDAGEINVMINGREGLAGPIAHLYLSRTGHWHVVTAGRSNHVKTGWAGPFSGLGNSRLLGIEAQHAGSEPWTEVQYRSYVHGVAAILRHTGWQVAGHFEHQPGDKTDPAFDMNVFRRDVATVHTGNTKGHNTMLLIRTEEDPTVYVSDGHQYRPLGPDVPPGSALAALQAAEEKGHKLVTVVTLEELEAIAGRPAGEPVPAPPVDATELAAALAPLLPTAEAVADAVLAKKSELAKAVIDEDHARSAG